MPARTIALMRAFISASGRNGLAASWWRVLRHRLGERVPRDHAMHEPECGRLGGGVAAALEDDLLRHRRTRRAARSGVVDATPRGTPRSTSGIHISASAAAPEVAGQGEPPAAAHRVTVDHRDGDLLEALEHGVRALEEPPELALAVRGRRRRRSSCVIFELDRRVRPRGKERWRARHDHHLRGESSRSALNALPRSVNISSLSELRRSGRFSVTMAMGGPVRAARCPPCGER